MNVIITEYLRINLDSENWECRRCDHVYGSARSSYKKYTVVYNRDQREVHKPLIDPELYEYTFAPDPQYCALLEFYCPGCAALIEVEYTVPGLAPLLDIELDIDKLKAQWSARQELAGPHQGGIAPIATGHNAGMRTDA
jgi:acetone carboxylase gamma subunit